MENTGVPPTGENKYLLHLHEWLAKKWKFSLEDTSLWFGDGHWLGWAFHDVPIHFKKVVHTLVPLLGCSLGHIDEEDSWAWKMSDYSIKQVYIYLFLP